MIAGPARYLVIALAALGCRSPSPAALVPAPHEAPRAPSPMVSVDASAEIATAEPAAAERVLPSACTEGVVCVPPRDFATRLCAGLFPEVALHMFAPKTPWKRAYLLRSFQAWHVGGHGDMRELRANEEVLIISAQRMGAGVQGLGGQPYDVLRWDGTCVSLMEDELSFKKPAAAVPANIAWKKLDPAFQSLLAEEKNVEMLRATEVRTCDTKSALQEPGKSKCEMARRQVSLAIAQSVGRGKVLPALSSIP